MLGSAPACDAQLDEILAQLGPDVVVARAGTLRLVVSTGGVFVLQPTAEGTAAIEAAAEQVIEVADRTRQALAEHLAWVPFVDWFVVVDSQHESEGPALPYDLVANTLMEARVVEPKTVADIADLLDRSAGVLGWRRGLPAD